MRKFVYVFLLAAALPVAASAQYAATQDSTLRGLQRVYVNFLDYESRIGPLLSGQIYEAVTLELRKSGLRVLRDTSELNMLQDGILNVTVVADPPGRGSGIIIRMDVEQRAQLLRTRQTLQMVTWYHEASATGAPHTTAGPLAVSGINRFLSQWLAANGR